MEWHLHTGEKGNNAAAADGDDSQIRLSMLVQL